MHDYPPQPKIDHSRIKYPSDRITLKQLRSLAGDDLDTFFRLEGDRLASMMLIEQNYGELGFAKALDDPARTREAIIHLVGDGWDEEQDGKYSDAKGLEKAAGMLADYYVRFGIAEGPASARQAIRRIEHQGALQAKQMLGRTGGD
jgi:hypothetical protein